MLTSINNSITSLTGTQNSNIANTTTNTSNITDIKNAIGSGYFEQNANSIEHDITTQDASINENTGNISNLIVEESQIKIT